MFPALKSIIPTILHPIQEKSVLSDNYDMDFAKVQDVVVKVILDYRTIFCTVAIILYLSFVSYISKYRKRPPKPSKKKKSAAAPKPAAPEKPAKESSEAQPAATEAS